MIMQAGIALIGLGGIDWIGRGIVHNARGMTGLLGKHWGPTFPALLRGTKLSCLMRGGAHKKGPRRCKLLWLGRCLPPPLLDWLRLLLGERQLGELLELLVDHLADWLSQLALVQEDRADSGGSDRCDLHQELAKLVGPRCEILDAPLLKALALGGRDLLTGLLEQQGPQVDEITVLGVEGLAGAPHVLALRPVDGRVALVLLLVDCVGSDDKEGGHVVNAIVEAHAGPLQSLLVKLESVDGALHPW
mmetsp:Transcript_40654/g.115093  ORF Transcript_40654/g.115093 Transcript_40654/m.115093 type:complete len:247 (-) Transcript_40654:706-1446(-)